MVAVNSRVYSRTHSIKFFSDNMRVALREVILENGLSPAKLVQDWTVIENGVRTWLESGHLQCITVEFSKPKTTMLAARWDFPVGYDGSGVDDDMWLDRAYLQQLIDKSARPSSDCEYRIILQNSSNAPHVDGFESATYLDAGTLSARIAGTAIATGHLTASVAYWR